ncbi:MAG: Asp-tRNA(Asn)/Glu-tRNA(Gln) amidotransferase subunit GatC [Candidatus Binataceae bacterium]
MSNPLTLADVERVAALAHLALTDAEAHTFLEQLNEILGYAQQIQKIDTTGVPPTAHVASRYPADRPDDLRPSLPVAAVLAAAPEPAPQVGLFKVPRVIGGIE